MTWALIERRYRLRYPRLTRSFRPSNGCGADWHRLLPRTERKGYCLHSSTVIMDVAANGAGNEFSFY